MAEQKVPPRDDPVWQTYAQHYPIVGHMLEHGEPLTREQWLIHNYLFDGVPDPVPRETEERMPPPFRLESDYD